MLRALYNLLLIGAILLALPGMSLAASDTAKVKYKDGKAQVFRLNRDASLIRRVMFDSEKKKDRMVVTYRDDTHQVFRMKQKISKVKRLVFEGGDKVEVPPKAPAVRPASRVFDKGTAVTLVPSETRLGNVWQVTEKCGNITWTGIWTRHGASNVFDAEWTANTGDRLSGIVEFREIVGGRVTLYRSDKGGTYTGTMSRDKKRIINGWATWYRTNCLPWYAVID